ncbi:uncharacterized protein B0H64DRAFT_390470 [Chaetomium fimeti]|uniref:Uncharacterized protein n=1 Tax=Chaetomium fimeti TaxID=1854472 RepID=A0AAE0LU33_9PEZI|nr:hypothetical protein B0H64DRAFT_390470 [Chaetomium fimeti]
MVWLGKGGGLFVLLLPSWELGTGGSDLVRMKSRRQAGRRGVVGREGGGEIYLMDLRVSGCLVLFGVLLAMTDMTDT